MLSKRKQLLRLECNSLVFFFFPSLNDVLFWLQSGASSHTEQLRSPAGRQITWHVASDVTAHGAASDEFDAE